MKKIILVGILLILISCKDDDRQNISVAPVTNSNMVLQCRNSNGVDMLNPNNPNNVLSTLKIICVDSNGKELAAGHIDNRWWCSHTLGIGEPRVVGVIYQLDIKLNGIYIPLSKTIVEWRVGERDVFVASVVDKGDNERVINQVKCNDKVVWEVSNERILTYEKVLD